MTTPFYRCMNDVQFDDSNVRNNPDNVKVDDSIMPDHVTTSEGGDGTSIAEEVKIIESIDQEKAELKALLSRADMAGLSYPYAMSSDHIPGMEGFFSRLWGEVTNFFQGWANWYTDQVHMWEGVYRQDWIKYANLWLTTLKNNMPSDEQFTGTVALRADRGDIIKHTVCLEAVCKLIKNLEKNVLSSEKDPITREMTNVARYLELNSCTVDFKRPSSSKAATRFTYGSLGRLGTMGYGTDCMIWLSNMSKNLAQFTEVYKILTDINYVAKAVQRMEAELETTYGKMEKAGDSQKAILSERVLNIKSRMTGIRALTKASIDFYNTTLLTDVVLPLQNLGRNTGKVDDLTSWILSTNKD